MFAQIGDCCDLLEFAGQNPLKLRIGLDTTADIDLLELFRRGIVEIPQRPITEFLMARIVELVEDRGNQSGIATENLRPVHIEQNVAELLVIEFDALEAVDLLNPLVAEALEVLDTAIDGFKNGVIGASGEVLPAKTLVILVVIAEALIGADHHHFRCHDRQSAGPIIVIDEPQLEVEIRKVVDADISHEEELFGIGGDQSGLTVDLNSGVGQTIAEELNSVPVLDRDVLASLRRILDLPEFLKVLLGDDFKPSGSIHNATDLLIAICEELESLDRSRSFSHSGRGVDPSPRLGVTGDGLDRGLGLGFGVVVSHFRFSFLRLLV